jgi:uncharacterized Zn finger protein
MRIMSWYYEWRPYVPVAQRRAKATAYALKLAKKEKRTLCPVKPDGRLIARTFWGKAWCENLERYSDYENRLPRGRTYVRNGSIIDLQMTSGTIKAIVSGSEIYHVTISIDTLGRATWKRIKAECSQSIDSLFDLLQGRFDAGVMTRLTERETGLFPQPKEIKIECSCPDWAVLCKHAAAVLYGVGARLDSDPELLFTLRNVDHLELVGSAVTAENLDRTLKSGLGDDLSGDLGEIFGIDLDKGGDNGQSDTEAEPKRKARKGTTALTADKGVERPPQATSKPRKASSRLAAPKKASSRNAPAVAASVSPPTRKGKEKK